MFGRIDGSPEFERRKICLNGAWLGIACYFRGLHFYQGMSPWLRSARMGREAHPVADRQRCTINTGIVIENVVPRVGDDEAAVPCALARYDTQFPSVGRVAEGAARLD